MCILYTKKFSEFSENCCILVWHECVKAPALACDTWTFNYHTEFSQCKFFSNRNGISNWCTNAIEINLGSYTTALPCSELPCCGYSCRQWFRVRKPSWASSSCFLSQGNTVGTLGQVFHKQESLPRKQISDWQGMKNFRSWSDISNAYHGQFTTY